MLVRTTFFLCLASAILQSAEVLRPPSLQKLTPDQFQRLLSESLANRANQPNRPVITGSNCSIPLLEAKVGRPEQFPMPRISPGKAEHDHIAATTPAPACKRW